MARVGIYGKHPGFGDFISAGMSDGVEQALTLWLDGSLSTVRQSLGDAWQVAFDMAPTLRFWIGGDVVPGGTPLRGVMAPSRDRVGRRHPLFLVASAGGAPCPAVDASQGFHDLAERHLRNVLMGNAASARDISDHWSGDPTLAPTDGTPMEAAWWAENTDAAPEALWSELAGTEARAASSLRSYWWSGALPARALACPGLPAADALHWLLTGAPPGVPPMMEPVAPEAAVTPPPSPVTAPSSRSSFVPDGVIDPQSASPFDALTDRTKG